MPLKKMDGGVVYFNSNNAILIRKKQDLKSKYIFGPVTTTLHRKKFKTLFNKVL